MLFNSKLEQSCNINLRLEYDKRINMEPEYSEAHEICLSCSILMFGFGTIVSILGSVFLSASETSEVGLFCLGTGAGAMLLTTVFCCHVKRGRSRQLKYLANGSSFITKLDRIETRLSQQSNVSFSINPPVSDRAKFSVADRVMVQFILFIVTEDFYNFYF